MVYIIKFYYSIVLLLKFIPSFSQLNLKLLPNKNKVQLNTETKIFPFEHKIIIINNQFSRRMFLNTDNT